MSKQILVDESVLNAVLNEGFDQLVTDFYKIGNTWEESFYQANELYFDTYKCEKFNSYDSWRIARVNRLKKRKIITP